MTKAAKIKTITSLTLLAFLLNGMLPFFAVYNFPQGIATGSVEGSEHAYPDNRASFFGGKILICTVNGFKWVHLEDLQNGQEQPHPHPQYQCAFCYLAANSAKDLILLPGLVTVPAYIIPSIFYQPVDRFVFTTPLLYDLLPRAPPATA